MDYRFHPSWLTFCIRSYPEIPIFQLRNTDHTAGHPPSETHTRYSLAQIYQFIGWNFSLLGYLLLIPMVNILDFWKRSNLCFLGKYLGIQQLITGEGFFDFCWGLIMKSQVF